MCKYVNDMDKYMQIWCSKLEKFTQFSCIIKNISKAGVDVLETMLTYQYMNCVKEKDDDENDDEEEEDDDDERL